MARRNTLYRADLKVLRRKVSRVQSSKVEKTQA
nr:MAG TPA: hypothetical protein [Caudoviricetes sp.]